MNKHLLLLSIFISASFSAIAQYTSPSSSKSWNMDSLVVSSGGVVTATTGGYSIASQLTISATDTLKIVQNTTISVAAGIEIRILGTLIIDPPDSVVMRPINAGQNFRGMEINLAGPCSIRKLHQYEGGGNRLLNCNVLFDSCRFISNNSVNASNVINLFRSNSIIRNCYFANNARSAIGGGGNIANAPLVENCSIIANVTDNSNRPQINMGGTGPDTAIIRNCVILGQSTNSGGIGFFPLGIEARIIIEDNLIQNNRYGIVCQSAPITGFIRRNQLLNNNIQNDPILGGSGINCNGGSSQRVVISQNTISGNLWGITVQNTAKPNMGDLRNDTSNIGLNVFANNVNGGITYHIYNNTPDTLFAQNNDFGTVDSSGIESTLFHKPDQSSLGPIIFDPWVGKVLGIQAPFVASEFEIYPNPAKDALFIQGADVETSTFFLISMHGQEYILKSEAFLDRSYLRLPELTTGMYLLVVKGKKSFNKTIFIE